MSARTFRVELDNLNFEARRGDLYAVTAERGSIVFERPLLDDDPMGYGFDRGTSAAILAHGAVCLFLGKVVIYETSDGSRTPYLQVFFGQSHVGWVPYFNLQRI